MILHDITLYYIIFYYTILYYINLYNIISYHDCVYDYMCTYARIGSSCRSTTSNAAVSAMVDVCHSPVD